MAKRAIFGLILLAICRAQAPQSNGSVEGRVTSITGEPLKNATIRLQAQVRLSAPTPQGQRLPPPPPVYSTTSDASGNFKFEAVDPASYSLTVQRTGYLNQAYTSQINVAAGQPFAGISIKLTPEGRIEGKVTNEDGEPVNASVTLYRWVPAGTGYKELRIIGGRTSVAADGSFVIGGLTTGRYYVGATVDTPSRNASRGPQPQETYRSAYYPGVPDIASAMQVEITPGSVAQGIDIRERKTRVYSVRGKAIVTSNGAPASGLEIGAFQADSMPGAQPIVQSIVRDDGTFELERVPAGAYILRTLPGPARNGASQQASVFGLQQITVTNEDVEDLVLRLNPGAEVTARVRMEDNSPLAGRGPQVGLLPFARQAGMVSPRGQSTEGGSWLFGDVAPAEYFPQITDIPPGAYVKSVRFGNQEISGNVIDLTSGSGGMIEIVLSPHAADLSGVVHDSNGDAAGGKQVALWMSGDGMVPRMAQTGPDGSFRFAGLPPGEYHVAAGSGMMPVFEVLKQLETRAVTIRLNEDAHQTNVEAPLLRQDAIDAAINGLR